MASVFKRKRDRQRKNASWFIAYTDENGVRHTVKGCPDKVATEGIACKLQTDVEERRRGTIDTKAEAYAAHAAQSLDVHLEAWKASTRAKGATLKHVELFTTRAARIIALVKGADLAEIDPPRNVKHADLPKFEAALEVRVKSASLADLTSDRVQKAIAKLRDEGRSLATCNHHRAAIKAFSTWCHEYGRTREDVLRGVTGYNANEDRRHDRRTISVDELRKLIEATMRGEDFQGVSGSTRALVYRLAVGTGLRYSEIGGIHPESFDWEASTVTVAACYTKNGQTATLTLPDDLVGDLRAYVATKQPGEIVFILPEEKGAKMLRCDLAAAGIEYRDQSGLVFDFHALRCQMATNADAAGASDGVIQKRLRHSSRALTQKYIRPRAVDIDAVAGMLPSLKPTNERPEALAATGTDGAGGTADSALTAQGQRAWDGDWRVVSPTDAMAGLEVQPLVHAECPEIKPPDASRRTLTPSVAITGEATRTPDLRIMRPPL